MLFSLGYFLSPCSKSKKSTKNTGCSFQLVPRPRWRALRVFCQQKYDCQLLFSHTDSVGAARGSAGWHQWHGRSIISPLLCGGLNTPGRSLDRGCFLLRTLLCDAKLEIPGSYYASLCCFSLISPLEQRKRPPGDRHGPHRCGIIGADVIRICLMGEGRPRRLRRFQRVCLLYPQACLIGSSLQSAIFARFTVGLQFMKSPIIKSD